MNGPILPGESLATVRAIPTHTTASHPMPVNVFNLATGETLMFVALSPAAAVVAAHEFSHGNANTWTWPNPHPLYRRTLRGHNCGEWAALNK